MYFWSIFLLFLFQNRGLERRSRRENTLMRSEASYNLIALVHKQKKKTTFRLSSLVRCVGDSNPWPRAWQARILTSWTNAPEPLHSEVTSLIASAKIEQIFQSPNFFALFFQKNITFWRMKIAHFRNFLIAKTMDDFRNYTYQSAQR